MDWIALRMNTWVEKVLLCVVAFFCIQPGQFPSHWVFDAKG